MKQILIVLGLMCAFGLAAPAIGQDKAAPPAAEAKAPDAKAEAAPAAGATAAPTAAAAATPAAAPAATPNKGDVSWMLISTALVLMMSIPALALFYGGMVRSKNMLSVLMQVFVVFSLITVLWCVYGYSLAFTEGNAFYGGFDRLFLKGTFDSAKQEFSMAATFSKNTPLPELVYVAFQATFAAITVCLILGAFAERVRFSAVLVFAVVWFTFAYVPIAHMVWFWPGPDAYTAANVVDATNAKAGWIWQMGALDFAGGTVVHINAGIAGLVCALVLGKRLGYGREAMAPHNLTLTLIGASLLWVGWFGFNAGSAVASNGRAGMAMFVTQFATAVAALAWMFTEWMTKGKPSVLGIASGAVAGLVAITPASGFVGASGALIVGIAAGIGCFFAATTVKGWFKYDDSLDAFGVHCVGGIIGAILTGLLNVREISGADGSVMTQLGAVVTTLVYSGVGSFIILKVIDMIVGLRVTEEQEREGLDLSMHGEAVQ